jgi:hypothetical protein
MFKVVYSNEPIPKNQSIIFLAGPTLRISDNFDGVADSWRNEAISLLKTNGFEGTVCAPEFTNGRKPKGWTYDQQIQWELEGLSRASVILFWIPRDLKNLPAFTTNIEFGNFINSGKIVIGAPPSAPKNEYLKKRCEMLGINWNNTLEDTVKEVMTKINDK